MQAIATQAGVAHGTVLWHFGSKAQLYACVVEDAGDRVLNAMGACLDQGARSIEEIVGAWFQYVSQDADLASILRSVCRDPAQPHVHQAATALNERLVDFWWNCLCRLEADRVEQPVSRTENIAQLIVATLSGLLATGYDRTTADMASTLRDFGAAIEEIAFGDRSVPFARSLVRRRST